jgi:hypothetical protein
MREHVDGLRALAPRPEEEDGFYERGAQDPLLQWPRVFHPHRQDARTREWLLEERNTTWASALLDTTPLACQTMVYFKPPGSRGQAMHQDQYFLRARPGTSLAVWMALDACDDANGCIRVIPGSQDWPVLCPTDADPEQSFTRESLPVPEDAPQVPVELQPGDVLFFNGSLVHGSMPNRTSDRFRRSLIAHFIEERATSSVDWIQPVLHPDGRELWLDEQDAGGGPCGTWVERDGAREIAAMYLANKFQNIKGAADTLLELAEIEMGELKPVADAMERGGRLAAKEQISDDLLDRCKPIAGTAADCIKAIEEYREAGCTHVMLELWGANRHRQIELFGEKVLPHFR